MTNEIPIKVKLDVSESRQEYGLEVRENSEKKCMCVDDDVEITVNRDYNYLKNKPSINGVILEGNKTSEELGIDQTYIYTQPSASRVWTIVHNLNKHPSVTVVDSAGTVVVGDIQYVDDCTIICSFIGAFSGKAYLN